MKIAALADIHGQLHSVSPVPDDADAVVIAGDIAPDYSRNVATWNYSKQCAWLDNVFVPWAEDLDKPVYGCYGNHDYGVIGAANENINVKVCGIADGFFLFSYTPEFCGWNYMLKDFKEYPKANGGESSVEEMINLCLESAEEIPDIWVCHGPPHGFGDFPHEPYAGSKALLAAARKYEPKIIFCGHIHSGVRESRIGNTAVYNVSVVNEQYEVAFHPTVVEI